MKNPLWSLEEAIGLIEVYLNNAMNPNVKKDELQQFRQILLNRIRKLDIKHEGNFRNIKGLNIQLRCIDKIFNNNYEGFGQGGKIFIDAYKIYKDEYNRYKEILETLYCKYK